MRNSRNNILVPINFKSESLIALKNTYKIAAFVKAKLVLLYVIPPVDFVHSLMHTDEEFEKIQKEAHHRLNVLANEAQKESGLEVITIVKQGKPYKKILETAEEIQARFIIMGKRIPEPDEVHFLGSIITQVVRQAKVPVITMKGSLDKPIDFSNFLLPLDLTQHSREKVFNAIAFALHYKAKIHLVSVLMGGVPLFQSRIYRKMKRITKIIRENGVACTMHLYKKSERPVDEVILEHARIVGADMMFIMTHKESNISDNYIGAVAYKLINHSDIPVLSVTSHAAGNDNDDLIKTVLDPFGIWNKKKDF